MKHLGLGLTSIVRVESVLNLNAYTNQMDLWLKNIDGLSITGDIGLPASLVEFSNVKTGGDRYYENLTGCNMLDGSATYEYYYEFILDDLTLPDYTELLGSLSVGLSFRVRNGGGWYIIYKDKDGNSQNYNTATKTWLVAGLNKVKITFICPTKQIHIDINGNTWDITHTLPSTQLGIEESFRIGAVGAEIHTVLYFSFTKNGVIQNEVIFSELYQKLYRTNVNSPFVDLVTGEDWTNSFSYVTFDNQSLVYPYINGYDLYWNEGTIDGIQRIVPRNSLGVSLNPDNYSLFYRGEPDKIGYHAISYIEMPNLPIFDTTDRTFWKVAIESDPFYVGGTAGKERYFHKTWLNVNWINTYIEDAYKGMFFVKLKKKYAIGQSPVAVEISDIVLFKEPISTFTKSRDATISENLGDFYMSKIADFGYVNPVLSNGKFYLFDSKGDKRLMSRDGRLKLSIDNGFSWNTGILLSDIGASDPSWISLARILDDGNIVIFNKKSFGTSLEKIAWYSDDNLETITPCTYLNSDDSPFVFHTPVSETHPGSYFDDFHNFVEDDGLLVFGNYANSIGGASPVLMWYSIDSGATWKVFYEFGQNPDFRDNGSSTGGVSGNLLGDATNPLITRHIHGINKGFDGNYYACTGDSPDTPGSMHFMKMVYDSELDSWTVNDLLSGDANTWERLKGIGIYERNGYIYWGSDGTSTDFVGGITYTSHGIYRCLISDLNDITKHELLHELPDEAFAFLRMGNGNDIFCGLDSGNEYCLISRDGGDTWEEINYLININAGTRPAHFDSSNNRLIINREFIVEDLV